VSNCTSPTTHGSEYTPATGVRRCTWGCDARTRDCCCAGGCDEQVPFDENILYLCAKCLESGCEFEGERCRR